MGLIKIALVDEHGNDEAVVTGDTHLLDPILPHFQSDRFQCLRFIDPFGDTVFNRLQMQHLTHEWDALQRVSTDVATQDLLAEVADLIRKGTAEPHTYLKFIGD